MAVVAYKSCSVVAVVAVGLIVLVQCTAGAPAAAAEDRSAQTDLTPAASGTNARFFDLSSWTNRYPYNYNRPYYTGGNYNPSYRPGAYPNYNTGYYPNYNYNGFNTNTNNGYYPNYNTGFGTGNGGYGGFGGNGGLTTYYGYGRDDYYGDRNMGFGYQQGTNRIGFSRVGDQNLNSYNSYSSPTSPSTSGGYSYY